MTTEWVAHHRQQLIIGNSAVTVASVMLPAGTIIQRVLHRISFHHAAQRRNSDLLVGLVSEAT